MIQVHGQNLQIIKSQPTFDGEPNFIFTLIKNLRIFSWPYVVFHHSIFEKFYSSICPDNFWQKSGLFAASSSIYPQNSILLPSSPGRSTSWTLSLYAWYFNPRNTLRTVPWFISSSWQVSLIEFLGWASK